MFDMLSYAAVYQIKKSHLELNYFIKNWYSHKNHTKKNLDYNEVDTGLDWMNKIFIRVQKYNVKFCKKNIYN